MRILYSYILKEHIRPFFLGLLVLTFILIMNRAFELVDMIIGKGLSVVIVSEIFFLSLPFIIALTVPMAVLVAVLMAFGRLSHDQEIVAMRANGIRLASIMTPVLIASFILSLLMVSFNNRILPESNHKVKNLMIDVARKKPAFRIKEGVFMSAMDGYNTLIKKIDQRTQRLFNIVIWETKSGMLRVVSAPAGRMQSSKDGTILSLELYNGEIHELDQSDLWIYRTLSFEKHLLNMEVDAKLTRKERSHRSDRELSALAMRKRVDKINEKIQASLEKVKEYETDGSPKALGERDLEMRRVEGKKRERNRYLVEIQKKYSIPFACVVFVVLGLPLGVVARRGGAGVGFGVAILFFVLYYIGLVSGEELADRGILSPFVGMWGPNVLLLLVGMYLFVHVEREIPFVEWRWVGRLIHLVERVYKRHENT
ncbi:YjgP/YjgQ family permease [candidate division TA06 bacterium]|uniref:YjgP/YjgQ family permease n=1 Tax=candidate division TA06 bacterium TaxID=2250710 RepID=A0A523UQ34_UNCT6|nr:MAG: YjgP/YjgQ family permease [candidate division TA06 bacterium]